MEPSGKYFNTKPDSVLTRVSFMFETVPLAKYGVNVAKVELTAAYELPAESTVTLGKAVLEAPRTPPKFATHKAVAPCAETVQVEHKSLSTTKKASTRDPKN